MNLFEILTTMAPLESTTTWLVGGAAVGTGVGLNKVVQTTLQHRSKRGRNDYLSSRLKQLVKSNRSWLLSQVILPQYDSTVEIPYLIVSEQGLVVIETINQNGKIYGVSSETQWNQVNEYGKVNRFDNPILKTERLIKTLKYQLKINNIPYIPIYSMVISCSNQAILMIDDDRIYPMGEAEQFLEEFVFRRAARFKPKEILQWMDEVLLAYET